MKRIEHYQIVSHSKYDNGEFKDITILVSSKEGISKGERLDFHGIRGTVSEVETNRTGLFSLILIPDQSNY